VSGVPVVAFIPQSEKPWCTTSLDISVAHEQNATCV